MRCSPSRQTMGPELTAFPLWRRVFFLVSVLAAGALAAESMREQVEADWQRQDACRIAQIREPGLVRFVKTELQ